jgi:tetratricopeptide (TPR) repeat protein
MKRALGIAAAIVLFATVAGAEPSTIVVEVDGSIDADRVRAAIGRELGVVVVADAPRGNARVVVRARDGLLTVTFRRGDAPPISRTVGMPPEAKRAEASAVILAGNLARDEAADVVAEIRRAKRRDVATREPPTPEQAAALATLGEQTRAFERGAKDYRDTVATIVRLHYETKKREVLSGLDRELANERAEVKKARDVAIARLEAFLAAHPTAPGDAVPDALYRLGALYDEASRSEDAARMYRRVLGEYPQYREIAAVRYFLGHALEDLGRADEAQSVRRALVAEERPNGARYVAETWWQIGNWHFDRREWAIAEGAYARSMKLAKEPLYGVALYKLAWAIYMQEDWPRAAEAFTRVIARGDDMRDEALLYVAGALANGPLSRIEDPAFVPQDKPWTVSVWRAVANELVDLGRLDEAITLSEKTLRRWPNDARAAETQKLLGDTLEAKGAAERALEAREKLSAYVGNTPWVDANKDNPEAIARAEKLAREGLRRVAAHFTNVGRETAARGDADSLARASSAYARAASAWTTAPGRDDESRYWNADARRNRVRIAVRLHQMDPAKYPAPAKKEIDEALLAALEARDDVEDDKYVDNAALFVVDVTDVERDLAALPKRTTPSDEPIPRVIQASMNARDEYVRLVPASRDYQNRGVGYRLWVAETYFMYRKWDVAAPRLEALWREQCIASAWEMLVAIAAKRNDEERATKLVDAVDPAKGGKSCDAAREAPLAARVRAEVDGARAARKTDEASKEGDSAKRRALRREAAALQERAGHPIEAAWAYREAGDASEAIAIYERVIQAKDAPKDDVSRAYEGLTAVRYVAFDYEGAASANARLAVDARFEETRRREAATNAMILYGAAGRRAEVLSAHGVLLTLHPSTAERAVADFRAASIEGDTALARYVGANRSNPAAGRFVVEAAYAVAEARRGEDRRGWLRQTVASWDAIHAQDAPLVDHAAEAAFRLADEDVRFDAYPERAADVFVRFSANAERAKKLDASLQHDVIAKYRSPAWIAASLERQGAIWDALRTGLYATTKVRVLDARAESLVAMLRKNGQEARADTLEDTARDVWLARKQKELDAVDALAVARYATAVDYGKKNGIPTPTARSRLAYLGELVGEAKMRAYVTAAGLSYTDRMYAVQQPGVTSGRRTE